MPFAHLKDGLLAAQGEETSTTNENHMVFEGPPGTAKTTFARIVAEILFGLGKIQRPEVKEVTEEEVADTLAAICVPRGEWATA